MERRRWPATTNVLINMNQAHPPHVLDALHGRGADIRRELLVAEDGEPLLQRELEPVPAGHAVARPIMYTCVCWVVWFGEVEVRVG